MTNTTPDNSVNQSALRAVPMTLFPTLDSLDAVVEMALSKTPVVSKNEMRVILMTYHNTLLNQINKP